MLKIADFRRRIVHKIVRVKSKLVCPYCKEKQEFSACDYFLTTAIDGTTSEVLCDSCDQNFNATLIHDGTTVITYSNGVKLC